MNSSINLQNVPNLTNVTNIATTTITPGLQNAQMQNPSMTTDNKGTPNIPLMPVILTPNDAIRALATSLPITAVNASNMSNMGNQPVNPLSTMLQANANGMNNNNMMMQGANTNPANVMSFLQAQAKKANNANKKAPNGTSSSSSSSGAEQEAAELRQELD